MDNPDDADANRADSGDALDGLTRAAVFAQIVGEEAASVIFKHLNAKEVQKLAGAMKDLNMVPQKQVRAVMAQFIDKVGMHSSLGVGTEDYIRDVLVRAHGGDKATGIMDRLTLGGEAGGLESLKWMDPRQVAEIVRDEHPQIKAIVLSYLEPDQAAATLGLMPARSRADLILRVATLDAVQPEALRELNQALERRVSGSRNLQTASLGGG